MSEVIVGDIWRLDFHGNAAERIMQLNQEVKELEKKYQKAIETGENLSTSTIELSKAKQKLNAVLSQEVRTIEGLQAKNKVLKAIRADQKKITGELGTQVHKLVETRDQETKGTKEYEAAQKRVTTTQKQLSQAKRELSEINIALKNSTKELTAEENRKRNNDIKIKSQLGPVDIGAVDLNDNIKNSIKEAKENLQSLTDKKYILDLDINANDLEIIKLSDSVREMQAEYIKATKTGEKLSFSVKKLAQDEKKLKQVLDQEVKSVDGLERKIKVLTHIREKTTKGTIQYDIAAARVRNTQRELNKVNGVAAEKIDDITESTSRNTKEQKNFTQTLKKGIGLIGAYFSAQTILEWGKAFYSTSKQIQGTLIKTDKLFGQYSTKLRQYAKENANNIGLTTLEFEQVASKAQEAFLNLGFDQGAAAEVNLQMLELTGSLSEATKGTVSVSEASIILTEAMAGEVEGLKELNINLSENEVQQRLVKNGQNELTGSAKEQATALATLELIYEKSTDAQEDFRIGGVSLELQQNRNIAKLKEYTDSFSNYLIPVFSDYLKLSGQFIDLFDDEATTLGKRNAQLKNQAKTYELLEDNISSYIEKYNELSSSNSRNENQQREFEKITVTLANSITGLNVVLDDNGKIAGLSSDRIQELFEETKKFNTDSLQRNIAEGTKEIEKLDEKIKLLSERINNAKAFQESGETPGFFGRSSFGGSAVSDSKQLDYLLGQLQDLQDKRATLNDFNISGTIEVEEIRNIKINPDGGSGSDSETKAPKKPKKPSAEKEEEKLVEGSILFLEKQIADAKNALKELGDLEPTNPKVLENVEKLEKAQNLLNIAKAKYNELIGANEKEVETISKRIAKLKEEKNELKDLLGTTEGLEKLKKDFNVDLEVDAKNAALTKINTIDKELQDLENTKRDIEINIITNRDANAPLQQIDPLAPIPAPNRVQRTSNDVRTELRTNRRELSNLDSTSVTFDIDRDAILKKIEELTNELKVTFKGEVDLQKTNEFLNFGVNAGNDFEKGFLSAIKGFAKKVTESNTFQFFDNIQPAIDGAKEVFAYIEEKQAARVETQAQTVNKITSIASEGNAELLEEETNRLNELQAKREKAVEAQKKLDAIATISASVLAIARVAADSSVAAPVIIPVVIGAIATGIAAVLSLVDGAATGNEYIQGPGTETSDSVLMKTSKGERVVTARENRDYWDVLHMIHNRKIAPGPANKMFRDYVGGKYKSNEETSNGTTASSGNMIASAVNSFYTSTSSYANDYKNVNSTAFNNSYESDYHSIINKLDDKEQNKSLPVFGGMLVNNLIGFSEENPTNKIDTEGIKNAIINGLKQGQKKNKTEVNVPVKLDSGKIADVVVEVMNNQLRTRNRAK